MSIEEVYKQRKSTPSDINEHLETLFAYAKECETIVEMGAGEGAGSTWAFLNARPISIISYDIVTPKYLNRITNICKEENQNYEFRKMSTIECDIEKTDLLFIDTDHTYDQLIIELNRHHNNVNKYIILHDTTSFGEKGERGLLGLNFAIKEFIDNNMKTWKIQEVFKNNNGLTILKRINL